MTPEVEALVAKAKEEAKRIVENAKRESEAMIAELRAMKKAGGAQEHEIQKVKKQMEKAQDELADKKEVGGEIPKSVKAGDMVHIASMDVDATIVAPADSKGYVQLKVGMMKMRAPLSDLRTLTATQQLVKKEQKSWNVRNPCGSPGGYHHASRSAGAGCARHGAG